MVVTSVLLCTTLTAFWGTYPYSTRLTPKGNCSECCAINEKKDITFYLFTRKNQQKPQHLLLNDKRSIEESHLRKNDPTVFYIHGFTERFDSRSATAVKNAYLKKGSFNIILVDWNALCAFPWYAHSVVNTQLVGVYLAKFIQFIVKEGVPMQNIHLIGFSLGAKVAGIAGKELSGKLPRITGLDPALPLSSLSGKRGHLASTDAEFVDVIHTDGGVFGFQSALGDADFFPNGGIPAQPGCHINSLIRQEQINRIISCSHNRAWQYYIESILNEKAFPATKCSSYEKFKNGVCAPTKRNADVKDNNQAQYMGFAASSRMRGNYFLVTNNREPFATNVTKIS